MRAIRVHRLGDLDTLDVRSDDLPDPTPGPDDVLVRVEAAGVNPVDVYVASGTYALKPDVPYVPGADAAGVVEAVGGDAHASGFAEGDRVWVAGTARRLQGCYAETLVTPARQVRPLPRDLTFAQGAALNTAYATAFRAVIDVPKVRTGERVLVHGATGGVGTAAVQVALAHGLDVWGTAGSDAGRELLVTLGVNPAHILDHRDPEHLSNAHPGGFDVIVEMLADENLGRDLPALSDRGRVVVVGNRGWATIDARHLMARQACVIGMTYWSGGDAAVQRALDAVAAGVEAGDLKPVVQETFGFDRCVAAWATVMSGKSGGKVALVP